MSAITSKKYNIGNMNESYCRRIVSIYANNSRAAYYP